MKSHTGAPLYLTPARQGVAIVLLFLLFAGIAQLSAALQLTVESQFTRGLIWLIGLFVMGGLMLWVELDLKHFWIGILKLIGTTNTFPTWFQVIEISVTVAALVSSFLLFIRSFYACVSAYSTYL